MLLLPIRTGILRDGSDLAATIAKSIHLRSGDIVVVSSKVIATVEGATIDLSAVHHSLEAERLSKECGRSPAFCEAVLEECERLRGSIVGGSPGALLTKLKPAGLQRGAILTANAGLDESNTSEGTAIGWPRDPVRSARELKGTLEERCTPAPSVSSVSSKKKVRQQTRLAVIISDSSCLPRRVGVTAIALTVCGLDPIASQAGQPDLFGKPLSITTEAVADQLATAANMVMGNAGQSIPAVIIRNHGITLSEFAGWVDGIESKEDLFRGVV